MSVGGSCVCRGEKCAPACGGGSRPASAKSGSSTQRDNECPICTELLQRNARELRCGHVFCDACIGQWEARSSTCPVCRQVIDPDHQAEIERRRHLRRLRRLESASRSQQTAAQHDENDVFPPSNLKAKTPGVVCSLLLLALAAALFLTGIFAIRRCHKLMFSGFPFWGGIHMAVVACVSLTAALKPGGHTLCLAQVILSGFGLLFGLIVVNLGGYQLYFSANGETMVACNQQQGDDVTVRPPQVWLDVGMLACSALCTCVSGVLLGLACDALGCNCCFLFRRPLRWDVFPQEPETSPPFSKWEMGVFLLQLVAAYANLAMGVTAYVLCHAFRILGLHIWGSLIVLLIAISNMKAASYTTKCKLTAGVMAGSFAIIISLVMMGFGVAQLSFSTRGETLEGSCSAGPVYPIDIALVGSSLFCMVFSGMATQIVSTHLINNRVLPTDLESAATTARHLPVPVWTLDNNGGNSPISTIPASAHIVSDSPAEATDETIEPPRAAVTEPDAPPLSPPPNVPTAAPAAAD